MTPLEDWPRPHLTHGGALPFLDYVVFGADVGNLKLSRSQYRCDAVPQGVELFSYGPESHPEVLDGFRQGALWKQLLNDDPALAEAVAAQTCCVVVRGLVTDGGATLNYFRNSIGLLTCLLDAGGVAIFEPQSFNWWSRVQWTTAVFQPAAPLPREHVVILVSDEKPQPHQWLHTRGMRKFGRPDLSVHGVTAEHFEAVVDLLNRFIEFQAFGGIVEEGQEIRTQSLPVGMHCVHGGDEEDQDFNNAHVEIRWPTEA